MTDHDLVPTARVEVKVTHLRTYEVKGVQPRYYVELCDDQQRRFMIWIDLPEAWSINSSLSNKPYDRPLTYDAMALLIEALDATVEEVWINEIRDEVFYSILSLRTSGMTKKLDLRPSDSIAIALRIKCPIYASESVISAAAKIFSEWEEKQMNV